MSKRKMLHPVFFVVRIEPVAWQTRDETTFERVLDAVFDDVREDIRARRKAFLRRGGRGAAQE